MRGLLYIGVIFALLATALTHQHLSAKRADFPEDQDLLYLPPPEQLAPMSLGFKESLADLIWIRAVVFAGSKEQGCKLDWIQRYLDTIFHLAPTFRRPYTWGGVVTVYTGGQIDRMMIDQGVSLYRAGLQHFPEDHELLFALGMLLWRDVPATPGYSEEERNKAKREGAKLIHQAAAFGAPPLVRQLAATLVEDSTSDQLAIQFLENQLLQTDDEDFRRMLKRKLERLSGNHNIEQIENLKTEFEMHHQNRFPYLPQAIYALLDVPK